MEPRLLLAANSVVVDWDTSVATTTEQSYGVNVWRGNQLDTISNSSYLAGQSQISPGLTRVHAAETLQDVDANVRGWLDVDNQSWDATKIDAVLTALRPTATDLMINIVAWPSWMDTNNDNRLDNDKFDDFADFAADLVDLVNNQLGHNVKYWEVTNELDLLGPYYIDNPQPWADMYNQAAVAMKQVDASIEIGGVAYANPWRPTMGTLISAVADNLDFFTYHIYENGSASTPDADVYSGGKDIGETISYVRNILDSNGQPGTKLALTEFNISWTFDTFDERMRNHKGGVFDALVLKYAAEAGAWTTQAWNDADFIYGKLDPNDNFAVRPGGHVHAMANASLVGDVASVSVSNLNQIDAFAVDTEAGASVLLINRSNASHTVDLSFASGWTPSGTTVQVERVGDTGYASSTATLAAATDDFAMPAHSVALLRFDDPEATPILREAIADTYAKSNDANTNFGDADFIETYRASRSTTSFLKFDLAGLSSVDAAKLRLTGGTDFGTNDIEVFELNDNNWSESALTWNNKPALGASLGVVNSRGSDVLRYELDLTGYVQNALAAGQTELSLGVNNQNWNFVTNAFYSRESAGDGPALVIESGTGAGSGVEQTAVADAWTDSGATTTNHGGDAELDLYYAWQSNRNGYLMFDLGGIQAGDPVTLSIHAASTAGTEAVTLRGVSDTAWSETGIVWANQPAAGNTIQTLDVVAGAKQWYDFDVTAYVQSAIAGGASQAAFRLTNATWSFNTVKVDSRESAGFAPKLTTPGGGGGGQQTGSGPADAWIDYRNDGSVNDDNHGSATELNLYFAYQRYQNGLVTLELDNLQAGQNVTLRFRASTTGGTEDVTVKSLVPTAWDESTVTWNNQPAAGSTLGTFSVSGGAKQWYSLDITAYAQAQRSAGATQVSFLLENSTWSFNTVKVDSRESGFGPELIFT
ncbi:MAG: DNRLRE domain-containing protein [Planctomycetota bacterium]